MLEQGRVEWKSGSGENSLAIAGGFAEVKDNLITLCVETGK